MGESRREEIDPNQVQYDSAKQILELGKTDPDKSAAREGRPTNIVEEHKVDVGNARYPGDLDSSTVHRYGWRGPQYDSRHAERDNIRLTTTSDPYAVETNLHASVDGKVTDYVAHNGYGLGSEDEPYEKDGGVPTVSGKVTENGVTKNIKTRRATPRTFRALNRLAKIYIDKSRKKSQ